MINLVRDAGLKRLASLGKGFRLLWNEPRCSYIKEFLDIVQDICKYTQLVNEYVEGRMVHVKLSETIDQRNLTQHKLLSLPTGDAIEAGPNSEAVESIYEPFRLATNIFSLLVVFPLPPETAPFALLASKLREQLSRTLSDGAALPTQPLLWILVMGGIAAIDTPHRSWFVCKIGTLMTGMGLAAWEDVRSILQYFLWLEGVSEFDGRMLLGEYLSGSVVQ